MNFPSSANLSKHPDLIRWLTAKDWGVPFDRSAVVRSASQWVISIKLTEFPDTEDNDEHLCLEAEVQGERPEPYHTELMLFPPLHSKDYGRFLCTSDCTCSRVYLCEHAHAVITKLKAMVNGGPVESGVQINPGVAAWLRTIRQAATPPPPAKPAKPYNKFLAYCIEIGGPRYGIDDDTFQFSTRIATRNKTGITIAQNYAMADPSRPTRYMSNEDLPICFKIHERARKHRMWGSLAPLTGEGWEEILTPALATGRMYLGRNVYSHEATSFHRLDAGAPLTIEAAWEELPGGAARPVLRLPSPEIRILPIEPLYYLNFEKFEIGPLHSHLPAAVIKAWPSGLAVPAASIPMLTEALESLTTDQPLPLPAQKPAQVISGHPPSPILHVAHVHVGIYQKRHIGGQLKFEYPGSQPLFPLAEGAPPTVSWFIGDRRVVLERDGEAESAFARQLGDHGLIPLRNLLPEPDLNHKTRDSVVISRPSNDLTEWLEFLESPRCQALRDNGWTIATDPKLNLTVHAISDFSPAIEADPEHGIDWFRFEISGESGGKRISLIPHIARAIAEDWSARYPDLEKLPETLLLPCEDPADGHIRFPARRFLEIINQVRHLFHGGKGDGPLRLDRISAAGVADSLAIDTSETTRALGALGRNLRDIQGLPPTPVPATVLAELRPYQADGFRWLQFLKNHGLHGILADDMGLGKTLQTLAHLAAEHATPPGKPSLVIAPTSVVPNWAAETGKFVPSLKVLVLQGSERAEDFSGISAADLVITSYPLLVRDFDELSKHEWHTLILDEAQYIKNPKAISTHCACKLKAAHRLCLSGTPMENHLGELWSLMRFLMPGFLADEKTFNIFIRKPIERDRSHDAQIALNRRISPLILRRTKDQVAAELPEKTIIVHGIDLTGRQTDLYESVRAAMDVRVREAIADKGLAKSHIIVLDALLKLRQICCHPQLLKSEAAQRVQESAKLDYLTGELLPALIEEGRRILIFSQFTSMLELIEEHLQLEQIPFLKLTGITKERANLVKSFQAGGIPIFLISLKAGGTGLNLTAADTVIHYDPWWNPAAESQATDRAHRIGQTKPVFVHKLVCRGTIEDRILELQKQKSALVEALLSEDTAKLRIDADTLSHLLSPLS